MILAYVILSLLTVASLQWKGSAYNVGVIVIQVVCGALSLLLLITNELAATSWMKLYAMSLTPLLVAASVVSFIMHPSKATAASAPISLIVALLLGRLEDALRFPDKPVHWLYA